MRTACLKQLIRLTVFGNGSEKMSYSVFRDDQGYWCWRLLSADNSQLAVAAARYRTQHECLAAVAQVKQSTDSRIMVSECPTA
jgi:uncharacterized protein YegP (UPF0339 family)